MNRKRTVSGKLTRDPEKERSWRKGPSGHDVHLWRQHERRTSGREFSRRGFDYDAVVVGACIAELPGCRLGWRNVSPKWKGGTATFEQDPDSDLQGIAYLVRDPLGVQAFEAKEKPAYVPWRTNIYDCW